MTSTSPDPDAVSPAGPFRDEKVGVMRRTIARRLAASKATAPHFYLGCDIRMDAMVAAREAHNAAGGARVSMNDIVVKAAAMALRSQAGLNVSWMEDRIRHYEHVNVGVAMAVEGGLVVPVVRDADAKPLAEVGSEIRAFAEKGRARKLVPYDWEGNTFTVSNLGMYGVDTFTAIINSPDSAILAVGAVRDAPVVEKGVVVPGRLMTVTLCCDHRAVDGAAGAAYLRSLKNLLEQGSLPA